MLVAIEIMVIIGLVSRMVWEIGSGIKDAWEESELRYEMDQRRYWKQQHQMHERRHRHYTQAGMRPAGRQWIAKGGQWVRR